MRELIVDVESSTAESLFLRDQDGHEYRLPVTDELRALITRGAGAPEPDHDDAGSSAVPPAAAAEAGDGAVDNGDDAAGTTLTPVSPLTPVPDIAERPERSGNMNSGDKGREASADGAPVGRGSRRDSGSAAEERQRSLPKPDPLLSNPLTMRPRDIQDRIRAGASTQELADEMQVAFSRVEPYAHPVMLERQRMAQIAKQSHPVREDGPAKLTLWEVLAAAFGTRGHSLADATWDTYKEAGNAWVVRLSWRAGLSDNHAEWVLRNHHSSSPTAEARDAIAADLTDPDFIQPVRSLSPISRGERSAGSTRAGAGDADRGRPADADDTGPDGIGAGGRAVELEAVPDSPSTESAGENAADENPSPDTTAGATTDPDSDSDPGADSDAQPKPVKRRRKAVTPHWEDVLLGVRSNTKRPRS